MFARIASSVSMVGRRRKRTTRGGISDGGGSGDNGFAASINLPGIDAFNGVFPYIDRVKSTNNLWNRPGEGDIPRADGRLNSRHFPTALPAGQYVAIPLWSGLDVLRATTKVKAGNYRIEWTPVSGATVTVEAGTGISAIVPGTAGVATFTLSAACPALFLVVNNLTGGVAGADDIKVFHVDHEATLDGGDILDPDFVSQITSWPYLQSVRFLDFMAANFSTVTNSADWIGLDYQSYCRADRGCPPEIIGLIGAKLPSTVRLWTVMPRTATPAAMATFFTKVKSMEPAGSRTIQCEGINEAWNSGFPAYTLLGTVDYIGLTVVDINNIASTAFNDRLTAAYMHHAMNTWNACEAQFGAGRTIRTVGVQTDWYAFMAAWIHYRDTTVSNLYGGATALTLVNPGPGRPTGELGFTWYFYAYNGTTIKQLLKDDVGALSNDAVKALWIADIDATRTIHLVPQCTNYRSRGYTGKFTTYEGACHDFWDRNDTGSGRAANFAGTCNTGTNTIDFPVETTSWITNGDQLIAPNQSAVSGTSFPHFFWVRKTGANSVRCYLSQALYDGDAGNTGVGAATVLAGSFLFCNQTRFSRWSDKISDVFKGSTGQELFEYVVENNLRHEDVLSENIALFVGISGDKNGTFRFSKVFDAHNNGQYGTDSPAITYLKGLGSPAASYWPGTVTASDGSVADINTKIAAATEGDVVTIPSGNFTWATPVTLNKGVHLRGAGGGKLKGRSVTSNTVGTGSKVFTLHAADMPWSPGETIEAVVPNASGNTMVGTVTTLVGTTLTINVTSVTGSGTFDFWVFRKIGTTRITFNTGAAINVTETAGNYVGTGAFDIIRGTSTADIYSITGSAADKMLIAHDMLLELGTGATDCFDTNNTPHLLAYNLSFVTAYSSPAGGIRTTSCFRFKNPGNTGSWTTASTLGATSNGEDQYFVEDCTFLWFSTEVCDFDDNSRTVWRYNDMNHSGITTHGQDTSAHGVRHFEIYNNHIYCNNDQAGALIPNLDYQIYVRGGSGVITDNVFTEISNGEWGDKTDVKMTCQSLRRNAGPNACYVGAYPCPRQVGQGHNGTTTITEGLYIWNNTGTFDLGVEDYSPDECSGGPAASTFIQSARDYFTTAKGGYSKYTYPHPFRGNVN